MRVSRRRRLRSTTPRRLRSTTHRRLRARHHPLLHLPHVLRHAGHLAHHAGLHRLLRLRLRRGALGDGEACRGDGCDAGSEGE